MKGLEQWRETIGTNVAFVDTKQYSHNIISMALRAIAKEFGKLEANKAIEDFGLEELGWQKLTCPRLKTRVSNYLTEI